MQIEVIKPFGPSIVKSNYLIEIINQMKEIRLLKMMKINQLILERDKSWKPFS